MGKSQTTRMSLGRIAINWLKAQYLNGKQFAGGAAIRDAIAMAHGGRLARIAASSATDWDRQARYELYREGVFVTQPIAQTGQLRNPNAAAPERIDTQRVKLRDLVTRTQHQVEIAKCAAEQIDATPEEIRQALRVEYALQMLADAAREATVNSNALMPADPVNVEMLVMADRP